VVVILRFKFIYRRNTMTMPVMFNYHNPGEFSSKPKTYRSVERYGTKNPRSKQAFDAYEARQAREAAKDDKEYWEDE
jgi:hypothetical protein